MTGESGVFQESSPTDHLRKRNKTIHGSTKRPTRSTHWVVYLRFEEMTVIMLAFSPRRISRLFRRVIQGETEKVSSCTFPPPFPSYIYMCFMAFASGHWTCCSCSFTSGLGLLTKQQTAQASRPNKFEATKCFNDICWYRASNASER